MKRIMLKLSGEALAGEKKTGFDEETVRGVALQVKQLVDDGIETGIVIGGGNFWRGRSSENMDRTKADQIGMLATVMNSIYTSEIFRSVGMSTSILTPFSCGAFTKLFSKDRANKYFSKGMVVFFAGGTGDGKYSQRNIVPSGDGAFSIQADWGRGLDRGGVSGISGADGAEGLHGGGRELPFRCQEICKICAYGYRPAYAGC